MKTEIKNKTKKYITILLGAFLVLFIFRCIYGYTHKETSPLFHANENITSIISNARKNYATKKHEIISANSGSPQTRIDQKYEKIAEIHSSTSNYDTDEKSIRSEISKYKALIQYEHKSGNFGYRNLNFSIGVPPENFDAIYQSLIKIGMVSAKQITKTDKTNEYKELNAKKLSLEKIRTALLELKAKGGRIEEFIQLENRILEIDQQLQDLGVSLGNFDDENEFCTVQISLKEGKEIKKDSLIIIKEALEWTIETYIKLMVALTFLSLLAYLLTLTILKLKQNK
ncbi:DUF4349 domain-containing protein [uncultured Maribacter sp.]|uniref:DUF4349 domain-containing protein n=1 Tax=uncultured Maribacter sp. TaxID=431308 RepID=UPI0026058029|nr:DUF4349 domain-containing protein [uncultured Maribacter sp.]